MATSTNCCFCYRAHTKTRLLHFGILNTHEMQMQPRRRRRAEPRVDVCWSSPPAQMEPKPNLTDDPEISWMLQSCENKWLLNNSELRVSAYRHRMSLQDGVDLAEVEELILLQVASLRPHGVQHGGRVTLRKQNGQPSTRVTVISHTSQTPTSILRNHPIPFWCLWCTCVTLERMKRSLLE